MYSFAFGIGTKNSNGDWLEVYFPSPLFKPDTNLMSQVSSELNYKGGNVNIELDARTISKLSGKIKDQYRNHYSSNSRTPLILASQLLLRAIPN